MTRLIMLTVSFAILLGSSLAFAEASIQDFCVDLTETECVDAGCEWVDDLCQAVTVTVDAGTPDGGESNGGSEMPSDSDSDASGCSTGGGYNSELIPMFVLLGIFRFIRRRQSQQGQSV